MYFKFESAVPEYYYRRFWSPTENEVLKCFQERGNRSDVFAIKNCLNGHPKAVGHLPREISRFTKFILDRGAEVEATFTSKHYRRSLLTQGGLEIPCIVNVAMPGTLLNKKLLKRYEEMVKDLYVKPKEIAIMGSFVYDDIAMGDEPGGSSRGNRSQKRRKKNAFRKK